MLNADAIKAEIAGFLDKKPSRLKETTLLSDLVQDSFLLVELYAHLQHKFGIEIDSEEFESIKTIGALIDRMQSGGRN